MAFDFQHFGTDALDAGFVDWLVDEQWLEINRHFGRLWDYYQNQMHELDRLGGLDGTINPSSKRYVQAQEIGLPARITGVQYSGAGGVLAGRRLGDVQRKEVVVENDITWRINAMVDFLFGKEVRLVSKSPDAARRRNIEAILQAVFAGNGGIGFFQDMAVLGSVYGFVDCVVRIGTGAANYFPADFHSSADASAASSSPPPHARMSFDALLELVPDIGLELIEAPRALPILDENDYRRLRYYVQHFYQMKNQVGEEGSFLSRLLSSARPEKNRRRSAVTEVLGPDWWQRYEDRELVAEGPNPLGVIPVVHIQNLAQPYFYEGLSDVEQLIGLQDELNTRLSDRANRVTFQAFKMYLAKGIEGVESTPVSPGQIWFTDNPEAQIDAFGGDATSPSEDRHIDEIREAMDKVSGVTPVVAGLLKNKIGNLTSGVALKMTFMGMLAKNRRKQFTYGRGIARICERVLQILDRSGLFPTSPADREVEVLFASPMPENTLERLQEAKLKQELGVGRDEILKELGYDRSSGDPNR